MKNLQKTATSAPADAAGQETTRLALMCAALGNIIWGFTFLFTRTALLMAPTNVMLAHQFLTAVVALGIVALVGKQRVSFRGKHWKPITIQVSMQLTYYVFESYGVLHTNATISGLVLAVVPIVTIFTGAIFLKEYPTKRQVLFCIMPVTGVIVMTISGSELGIAEPMGLLCLFISCLSSAIYKTANRRSAEDFSPFERTVIVLSISAICFTYVGFRDAGWDIGTFVAPLAQPMYVVSILGLGVLSSIVANLFINYASGKMSVFKISSFGALTTLIATFAGVVLLQEPMNLSMFIGAALILVGIRLVTKR